jgi:hypothetical protein
MSARIAVAVFLAQVVQIGSRPTEPAAAREVAKLLCGCGHEVGTQ